MLEALKKFKLKEGLIITLEQTDELKIEGKRIRVVPIVKWAGDKEL